MTGIPQVGDRLADRFEIFEVHQGGMGLVCVARDLRATPEAPAVALKTLRPEFQEDRHIRDRFASECRLWVRLGRHPNVVRAFAVEELEGRPYAVLEGVGGGDLRRWIGTPQLDLPRAIGFGIDFCLGMEHAIRCGLRGHRDIKPGNLLVGADGSLKITDFGLARLRDDVLAAGWLYDDAPIPLAEVDGGLSIRRDDGIGRASPTFFPEPATSHVAPPGFVPALPLTPIPDDAGGPLPSPDATIAYVPRLADERSPAPARMTAIGALVGTLPYMAPEQFEDPHGVDARADIYAFGVVMYAMIAGDLPFRGGSLAKWRRQHATYPPPSVVPTIPRRYRSAAGAVDRLVGRCLAKDPADRFPMIPELRRALVHLRGEVERPPRWPWRGLAH